MGNWEVHDILTAAAILVAVVGNFFFLKYFITSLRTEVDGVKSKAKLALEKLDLHEKNASPHKSCERHMDKISNNKTDLNEKVDVALCRLTHDNLNKELQEIKESLKPLADIRTLLIKLTKHMNGE